jgi:hypothetical protein
VGRLATASGTWGADSYSWDANDNRTRADRTIGGTTASDVATLAPGSNRLAELKDGAGVVSRSFAYTPGGDVASVTAGIIWQGARGSIIPWVVQIDKLGEAQAVEPANAGYNPSDPQIAFHLARFIEQVRAIPDDPIIVRQNWLRAYDFATDKGALVLNDYARTNDPFALIGKEQVAVDVTSVIRASSGIDRQRRCRIGKRAPVEIE